MAYMMFVRNVYYIPYFHIEREEQDEEANLSGSSSSILQFSDIAYVCIGLRVFLGSFGYNLTTTFESFIDVRPRRLPLKLAWYSFGTRKGGNLSPPKRGVVLHGIPTTHDNQDCRIQHGLPLEEDKN